MSWALVGIDIREGQTELWEFWLVAHERLEAPDILVYAVDGSAWDTDALPDNAVLLGPVAPLGGSAIEIRGMPAVLRLRTIALYSLGKQRVIRRFFLREFHHDD
jgi:hypothetical protein